MVEKLRHQYNNDYSELKYNSFLEDLNQEYGRKIPFRISESPVFIPPSLKSQLIEACDLIIDVISSPGYLKDSELSVPDACLVPGDEQKPLWLSFDFAICKDDNDLLYPQLVELQGFPSLFFYQNLLGSKYQKHFNITNEVSHLFELKSEEYIDHLRNLVLNNHPEENVILLEVKPEKQQTHFEFYLTEKYVGIKAVCISKLIREGRLLYYMNDEKKTRVHRIYNRIIFDEFLNRNDLVCEFNLVEDVDVEWAGHPNWFYKVSKFTLPFLKNKYTPETKFLNEVKKLPSDLENYVLKPIYSFAGKGVVIDVTTQETEKIKDHKNWVLQKKIEYAPFIQSPDGMVKAEIRMLFSWEPNSIKPKLIMNMVRMSKGEMVGVKYNKNQTWVGSSIAFFESATQK